MVGKVQEGSQTGEKGKQKWKHQPTQTQKLGEKIEKPEPMKLFSGPICTLEKMQYEQSAISWIQIGALDLVNVSLQQLTSLETVEQPCEVHSL